MSRFLCERQFVTAALHRLCFRIWLITLLTRGYACSCFSTQSRGGRSERNRTYIFFLYDTINNRFILKEKKYHALVKSFCARAIESSNEHQLSWTITDVRNPFFRVKNLHNTDLQGSSDFTLENKTQTTISIPSRRNNSRRKKKKRKNRERQLNETQHSAQWDVGTFFRRSSFQSKWLILFGSLASPYPPASRRLLLLFFRRYRSLRPF